MRGGVEKPVGRLCGYKMKKSTQVALGGICSALCLLLIFMTCMFPFTDFAFPALAGIVLIAVMIENGTSTAILVYAAVSILSVVIVPSKEAAMMFVFFFGYYPIVKAKLEKIPFRLVEYILKFALFNGAVITCYALIVALFGLGAVIENGPLGKFSLFILLGLGNVAFIIYDAAVTRMTFFYLRWFRPRILRKIQQ